MERRELLNRGLLLGAALVAESAFRPGSAAAQAAALSFFEGEIGGREFGDWKLFLSVAGTRAQGRADGPAIQPGTPEEIRGLRLMGRLSGGRLRLDLFALDDVNLTRPIGTLEGLLNQYGILKGSLRLSGRASPFHAWTIAVDLAAGRQLAGRYRGSIQDQGGNILYAGDLTVRPDQSWELRSLQAVAPSLPMLAGSPVRVGGRWGLAADGRILLSITHVPLRFRTRQAGSAAALAVPRPTRPGEKAGIRQSQPLRFSDTEFLNTAWSAVKVQDDTLGREATFEAGQVEDGGNPGAFRLVEHQLQDGGDVCVAHILNEAQYVRAVPADAPIEGLVFSYDLFTESLFSFAPLVVYTAPGAQPGYYVSPGPSSPQGWVRFRSTTLRLDRSLVKVAGPGPDHLEPSALGSFRFGFVSWSSTGGTHGFHTRTGSIDNFLVEVIWEAPEPKPTIELTGPATARVGTQVCYTATARDGRGAPMEGAQVLFLALGGAEAVVQTDAAGEARFCFTVTQIGSEVISAGLDLDRDFHLGLDESEDHFGTSVQPLPLTVSVTLDGPAQVFSDERSESGYTLTVKDSEGRALGNRQVGFQTDLLEPPTLRQTDGGGRAIISFAFGRLELYRAVIVRGWLDEDGDGTYTPGEPFDTTETVMVPADRICTWICLFVGVLTQADAGPFAAGPASTAIRLQHPYLQNLLLCAEPMP